MTLPTPLIPECRLHIDETGNHDLTHTTEENHRFLSLTGVILVRADVASVLEPGMVGLKGILGIPPERARDCALHRSDLINKRGHFAALKDPDVEAQFNSALIALVRSAPFTALTAVLDKRQHLARYGGDASHPYHYCLEVLLERYTLYLRDHDAYGDVLAEARGKVEDRALRAAFKRFCEKGTSHMSNAQMQKRLTSKELKLNPKAPADAGLELADLLAHPAWKAIQARENGLPLPTNFGGQLATIMLDSKFRRSAAGQIRGYGYKWLG